MPSQNPGFRVFTKIPRVDAAIVQALGQLETPYLSDGMNRFGGMDANLRPACTGMRLAGLAITVRVPPGDNLMVYKAMQVAKPGDVLVIEARGYTSVAQWGDITSLMAKKLGLAGMVTDGSLRDIKGICDVGFPVFAKPWTVPNGSQGWTRRGQRAHRGWRCTGGAGRHHCRRFARRRRYPTP